MHNQDILGMMNLLMQLKKVCNHPDLFAKRSEYSPLPLPVLTQTIITHFLLKQR